MTIRDSLYFIYDGIKSIDMNLINVNLSDGMQEEPFAHSRSIDEEEVRGRSKPYFKGITRNPLEFTVSFAFTESWDKESLQTVQRWLLDHEYYKPLIFSDNVEKVYYALVVDEPTIIHNGLNEGYVSLKFRCSDAYAYSPLTTSKEYMWDEEVINISQGNFSSTGELHGLSTNSNNKLVLSEQKPSWVYYQSNLWSEI